MLDKNKGSGMRLSRRCLLGAALAAPACALADTWPGALVMGTGRPGGSYTIYGPEWGRLAQASTGVDIAFRASGGAADNILLIEQQAAQLGMTTLTVAEQALAGTSTWTAGVKFQDFRALFPMFPSVLQIVSPRTTGIASLAALAGQVVGIGPDGASGSAAVPAILSALGVIPAATPTGDYGAQVQAMLAGSLAACAFIGAPPMPAIAAAAMGHRLSLIGFSAAEIAQVARVAPGMTRMVLPAGSFPGQVIAVASVGTPNFAIGTASLPDALARSITLAALRNQQALAALVPAAAQAPQMGAILAGNIAFHPGAVLALRGFGLDVPAKDVAG
jgi:TRAP transporter TAXI family solute receptor